MKKLTWLAMCVVAAFAVAASAEQGQGPKGERGARFKAADTDADGKLSATEFATLCTKGDAAAKFATADTDKDGFLTKDELRAAHQAGPGGKDGQGKGGCDKGKGGCQKGGEAPKA